ncbi:MAG: multidrug effflux MFS transporter [Rhodobacteraceae bacterium]|nr:multidrug effflux MFS transporter [Paracoccaceae bacterium]
MVAILFATVAFSVDAMLPALPQIAAELSPQDVNRAQLVIAAFVAGMGLGTFFSGPISDAIGRKVTITWGIVLYVIGAALAYFAQTLELLLAARFIQGLGASAPRIVSMAMIRDQYAGREMAQLVSFMMMIFILIPAAAPSLGALIEAAFGWRAIFGAFLVLGLIGGTWLNLRQPETHPPERRRPLQRDTLLAAVKEVLGHKMVRIYVAVLTLGFGQMFAFIISVQPIYDEVFDKAESFPFWFLVVALLSGISTIVNASLVMKLGMRRLAITAYGMQAVISAVMLMLWLSGTMPLELAFPVFLAWSVSVFFMVGLTFGNLNALALEPMGHIAGLAASTVSAISTVCSIAIAIPIGLTFNGTPVPLITGMMVCSALAWILMRYAREADPTPRTTPLTGG